MCGNFGLLALGKVVPAEVSVHNKPTVADDDLDKSLHESMQMVSNLNGVRVQGPTPAWTKGSYKSSTHGLANEKEDFHDEDNHAVEPLKILECQTASTEVRGGQAGGYSSLEYKWTKKPAQGKLGEVLGETLAAVPHNNRVRCVARKRYPLAADLAGLFLKARSGKQLDASGSLTVIGHTRFATSSVNVVEELHPHEWVPFHYENVWLFSHTTGRFEKQNVNTGIHITHNGDFDALEAYSQTMVVEDVGCWLERILHVPNNLGGDSPKIAGMMDLLRVQGRWGPAVRLAWVRSVLGSPTDVCDGEQLGKSAPHSFPSDDTWERLGHVFEASWEGCINNIVQVIKPEKHDVSVKKRYAYTLNNAAVQQLCTTVNNVLDDGTVFERVGLTKKLSDKQLASFVHYTIRGFLRGDLYTSLTEFVSRAEGSFGLQVHCSLEPGVVVIASKGQPMSLAFDDAQPMCLFGSEAEALSVPIFTGGKWLDNRLDLDNHGEIVRIGAPRCLIEGRYGVKAPTKDANAARSMVRSKSGKEFAVQMKSDRQQEIEDTSLMLSCGIEIKSYSVVSDCESRGPDILKRATPITSAPVPYDPSVDLVAADLQVIPAVISTIDRAWNNKHSIERISGSTFANALCNCMRHRLNTNKNTIDLLIAGVEASLWIAEQWAADLRMVFPLLNIVTTSPNKLLGLGDERYNKVFFPGSDDSIENRLGPNSCALLISQSGQTFPTLHATRKVAKFVKDKLWLLTGCFNSKMETAMAESYKERGSVYGRDRVFNNYSGTRPAEPTSVAAVATWHTLTHIFMELVRATRKAFPNGRLLHPWERDFYASVITRNVQRLARNRRHARIRSAKLKALPPTPAPVLVEKKTEADELDSPNKRSSSVKKSPSFKIMGAKEENDTGLDTSMRPPASSKKGTSFKISSTKDDDSWLSPENRIKSVRIDTAVSPKNGSTKFGSPVARSASSDGQAAEPAATPQAVQAVDDDEEPTVAATAPENVDAGVDTVSPPPPPPSAVAVAKRPTMAVRAASSKAVKVESSAVVVLNLSDGDIRDIQNMIQEAVVPNLSNIVGFDIFGVSVEEQNMRIIDDGGEDVNEVSTHDQLVKQGQAWADHIREPWTVILIVSVYLLISVGLNLPIMGLLADAVVAILKSAGANLGEGTLAFTPRSPHIMYQQSIGWTLIGLLVQLLDAIWYVYLGKNLTFALRVVTGRPISARYGKRTIVIVDSPCVHQLVENFVSKLFSQSYSFMGVDVHGASGLDHFVHRFTHRVVRGVLLAVGRPDGRLCTLSKSESAVLLAAKQAAFIRNPEYKWNAPGAGPEIVTVGHNPFIPSVGLAHHIVLHSEADRAVHSNVDHPGEFTEGCNKRRKFVDEYIYDRLFMSSKPFTTSILRNLRKNMTSNTTVHKAARMLPARMNQSLHERGIQSMSSHGKHNYSKHMMISVHSKHGSIASSRLPFGSHHIDPSILVNAETIDSSVFADFVMLNKDLLTPKLLKQDTEDVILKASSDPAVRTAFSSKLDTQTKQIQDLQVVVQQFYETRVASLERYVAFCVMFHAMAEKCQHPWFCAPWDVARSQSNLRVATTASPISAGHGGGAHVTKETKLIARGVGQALRNFKVNF